MTVEVEMAKERLRLALAQKERIDSLLTPDQAKIKFRNRFARLGVLSGDMGETDTLKSLSDWIRENPWQAVILALLAGILASQVQKRDIVLVNSMAQILAFSVGFGLQKAPKARQSP